MVQQAQVAHRFQEVFVRDSAYGYSAAISGLKNSSFPNPNNPVQGGPLNQQLTGGLLLGFSELSVLGGKNARVVLLP
jgi:hypothetical protein